jgi:hypothetical protein
MGKLLILILALILVLVILPGDLRDWCVMQFNTLMAGVSDCGDGSYRAIMPHVTYQVI